MGSIDRDSNPSQYEIHDEEYEEGGDDDSEDDDENISYIKNQKQTRSAWDWTKKIATRVYRFLSGMQTGIFIIRVLLLTGMIASGAFAASSLVSGFGAPMARAR